MWAYYEKGSVLRMIINKNDDGFVQVIEDEKTLTLLKNIIEGNSVESVNGKTGAVVLDSTDIGALNANSLIDQNAVPLFEDNSAYKQGDPVTFLQNPNDYELFTFKINHTDTMGVACWVETSGGKQIRGYYCTATSTPNVFIAFFAITNITLTNGSYTGTVDTLYYYNKNTNALVANTALEKLIGISYTISSGEGGD